MKSASRAINDVNAMQNAAQLSRILVISTRVIVFSNECSLLIMYDSKSVTSTNKVR